MPRDFDRQPSRQRPVPRRHPAAFGQFVTESTRPSRPRITIWKVLGFLAATVVAFFALSFIFGTNLVTLLISPLVGWAVYLFWYLAFEASA